MYTTNRTFTSDTKPPLRVVLHFPSVVDAEAKYIPNAIVCAGGETGGIEGPTGIFTLLAEEITSEPRHETAVARIVYRQETSFDSCVSDIIETLEYVVDDYHVKNIVLVGWDIGGAAALYAVTSFNRKSVNIKGIATLAPQLTNALVSVHKLALKNIGWLLLQGTEDKVVPFRNIVSVYEKSELKNKNLLILHGENHEFKKSASYVALFVKQWCIKMLRNENLDGKK